MKNKNIGTLGEAFIQRQLEFGIGFEAAWDEWQQIQNKLAFIIDCPDVQFYDDRRVSDAHERRRIREFAKSRLGKDIRSTHVSDLGRVAACLGFEVPVPPYHMDRNVVAEWLAARAEIIELEHGMGEDAVKARDLADSEEAIESISIHIERFAANHSLWAVPPEKLLHLFFEHHERLLTTSFCCEACKEEIVIPVEHEMGDFQRFKVKCSECGLWNQGAMTIARSGEAQVVWSHVASDEGDTQAT